MTEKVEVDRTTIEMLEEDGEYEMKIKDDYMDPADALQEAREVIRRQEFKRGLALASGKRRLHDADRQFTWRDAA